MLDFYQEFVVCVVDSKEGGVKHHVLNTETLFLCIKREWWSLLI